MFIRKVIFSTLVFWLVSPCAMACFGMNGAATNDVVNWTGKAYRSKFKVYQTISNTQMVKLQWGMACMVSGFPKAHWCLVPQIPHCLQIGCRYLAGTASTHQSPGSASIPVTWTGPCWALLRSETCHISVAKYWKCWWVSPRLGEERPSKPHPRAARRGRGMQGSSVGRALSSGSGCEISCLLPVDCRKPWTNNCFQYVWQASKG